MIRLGIGKNHIVSVQKIIHWVAVPVLIVLFLALMCSDSFAREKITIAVHDYPPYYNQDAKGMMTEVYQDAFRRVDVDAVVQTFPIKRSIMFLFENQVDAFSPGHILLDADLKKRAQWENSFIVAMVMIYYKPNHKQKFVYKSMEDLRGRKLAVLINSPYKALYKKHGLKIYEVQTPQHMAQMAKRGHVDFFVNTLLSGLIHIKDKFPDDWENFDFFVWNRLECSFAVNKANPDSEKWLGLFQKGFAQIKNDGTYIRLLEKYWGENNIPKDVLFPDLVPFGVDELNIEVFNKSFRNSWGQIIK